MKTLAEAGLFAFVTASLLLAGGCGAAEPESVRLCEEAVKAVIRSPGGYARVNAQPMNGGARVDLTFDAPNGFGVPLRLDARCAFALSGGGPLRLKELFVDYEAVGEEALYRARNAVIRAAP